MSVCVFAKCACVCARVYLKNSRGARGVKLFEAFSKAEPNQLLVNLAWLEWRIIIMRERRRSTLSITQERE